jgi:hypothetical protein
MRVALMTQSPTVPKNKFCHKVRILHKRLELHGCGWEAERRVVEGREARELTCEEEWVLLLNQTGILKIVGLSWVRETEGEWRGRGRGQWQWEEWRAWTVLLLLFRVEVEAEVLKPKTHHPLRSARRRVGRRRSKSQAVHLDVMAENWRRILVLSLRQR